MRKAAIIASLVLPLLVRSGGAAEVSAHVSIGAPVVQESVAGLYTSTTVVYPVMSSVLEVDPPMAYM